MLNNDPYIDDELLVSYLLGEADVLTIRKVEEWIGENPSNRRYFDHFKTIWELSKKIEIPATVNEKEAWQRFLAKTDNASGKGAVVKKILPLRAAAAIIGFAVTAALVYFLWDRSGAAPVTVAAITDVKADTLPDGSVVTINKNSSITYAGKLKGESRRVKLKGEAFFSVVADKKKPFVVETENVTVTVLGTSFNVKNLNGKTEVIVESGMVQVTGNNKTVILRPREKVSIGSGNNIIEKDSATDKLYNYYKTREFVCDNTPLWKLVEVLKEAYGADIIIENREIRNLPLTTTFYNESLDTILNIISQTFNITVVQKDSTIILK